MTGFSVAPVGPFAQQTDDGFPEFIQFQNQGVDLGGPDADTLDFGAGLIATRGVGENAGVVSVEAGMLFRDVYGDDSIVAADAGNAVNLRGTSGSQVLNVDAGELLPGQAVLVIQRDSAQGEITVSSGMTLLYRSDVFAAATAGQGATLTLLMCEDGLTLLVCGDMLAL